MYRAGEVSVPEHAASGLPNPTHLEGGRVRFDQTQIQQVVTTRRLRIVFTHSLDATYSRFCIGTILSISKHGYAL